MNPKHFRLNSFFLKILFSVLLSMSFCSFSEEQKTDPEYAFRIMSCFEYPDKIVSGYGMGIPVRIGEKNLILTVLHVVRAEDNKEATDVMFRTELGWIKCKVLNEDKEYDLCLLEPKIEIKTTVELSDNPLNEGDEILNANYFAEHRIVLKSGKLDKSIGALWFANIDGFSHGSSGSPVFDSKGKLIGMGIAGMSKDNGKTMTIAIFVPVAKIKSFLEASKPK